MRGTKLVAHGRDLLLQGLGVSFGIDDRGTNVIEPRLQGRRAQAEPRPRHGLVFPCPCGVVTALVLIIGIGLKGGDQQARVAVWAQGRVDFVQITFAGFDREPVDQFAHIGCIDFTGTFVRVFIHKHDVKVAAIAQLFAA